MIYTTNHLIGRDINPYLWDWRNSAYILHFIISSLLLRNYKELGDLRKGERRNEAETAKRGCSGNDTIGRYQTPQSLPSTTQTTSSVWIMINMGSNLKIRPYPRFERGPRPSAVNPQRTHSTSTPTGNLLHATRICEADITRSHVRSIDYKFPF